MATKKVNTISELHAEINKMVLTTMNDIAKVAEQSVKDHLQTEVYSSRPAKYIRTKQLLHSVSKNVQQSGKLTTASVFHDNSKIQSIAPSYSNNKLGQHHSTVKTYSPQSYNLFVAETVNDGTSGKVFGDGFWTKPRPYFTNARAESEMNFLKNLKRGLQYQGLTIR